MGTRLLTIIFAGAAIALAIPAAATAGGEAPTSFGTVNFSCEVDRCTATGRLDSTRRRCERNRLAKFFVFPASGPRRLIDTDRSSHSGAVGLRGRVTFKVDELRVVVPRRTLGRGDNTIVCGPALAGAA